MWVPTVADVGVAATGVDCQWRWRHRRSKLVQLRPAEKKKDERACVEARTWAPRQHAESSWQPRGKVRHLRIGCCVRPLGWEQLALYLTGTRITFNRLLQPS